MHRNAVQPIRNNPFMLEINATPVLSNDIVTKINTDEKIIEDKIMNLLSFRRNGKTRKNTAIGNIKNWIPPHEARPNASKIPAPMIFAMDTFPSSDFIPLISR